MVVGQTMCREGELAEGTLGFRGFDCRGECTLTMNEKGQERSWSFTTEPEITGIERGSSSDGKLEEGDRIVAIDGMLITTAAGGDRFANIAPGEEVTIRYRRDGRIQEATVVAGTRCMPVPEATWGPSRIAPAPRRPDRPRGVARSTVVAPTLRVRREGRGVSVVSPRLAEGVSTLGLIDRTPKGRLGIGFSCQECGTQRVEESDEVVWFFSGPIEVTMVDDGGPGEDAGIQRGDLIKAVNGHRIESDAGGKAFSEIEPDVRVRLTLVKRNGREVEVTVVPKEKTEPSLRVAEVAPLPPDAPRTARGVSRSTIRVPDVRRAPDRPDRVEAPVPAVAEPPEGMPLRYSGTVAGVEVEVRGEPVTVSELEGTRIILINAEGIWIRIRVPEIRRAAGMSR